MKKGLWRRIKYLLLKILGCLLVLLTWSVVEPDHLDRPAVVASGSSNCAGMLCGYPVGTQVMATLEISFISIVASGLVISQFALDARLN